MKTLSDLKIFPGECENEIREALSKLNMSIEVSGGRIKIAANNASDFGFMLIMTDLLKALTKAAAEMTKDKAIAQSIVTSGICVYLEDELQVEPWRMFTDQKPDCLKALDNEEECPSAQDGEKERANNAKENNDK